MEKFKINSRNLKDINVLISNSNSNSEINKINNKKNDIFINQIDNIKINNINYNDYELDNLSYEEALKYDKRSYCQYYISQIKYKQLLIFVFFTYNDYNSRI